MSHRGIFGAVNGKIDLRYLHRNINSQIKAHNKNTGHEIKPIQLSTAMPNKIYAFQHTKISVNDYRIFAMLDAFFKNNLTNHSSTPNEFVFATNDIKNSKLTYKDAHEFLFNLNKALTVNFTVSTEPKSAAFR
jgi:hypothetical protein